MKDKTEKIAFWSSWMGACVAGLGVLCLAIVFVYLQNDTERMPEWNEVHQQLSGDKWFEQYFEHLSKIEPLSNSKYARHWAVERTAAGMKGFFTVTVVGWAKMEDKRESYQKFVVYFRKPDDRQLVITKIEESLGTKVIYEEPNQALLPTATSATSAAAQGPRQQ